MSQFLYASDHHGNSKSIIKYALTLKPEASIILGDFGLTALFEVEQEQSL